MVYFSDYVIPETEGGFSLVPIFKKVNRLETESLLTPLRSISLLLDKFYHGRFESRINNVTLAESLYIDTQLNEGTRLTDIVNDKDSDTGIYTLPGNIVIRTFNIHEYANNNVFNNSYYGRGVLKTRKTSNKNMMDIMSFFYYESDIDTIVQLADSLLTMYFEINNQDVDVTVDNRTNNIILDKRDVNAHIFSYDYISMLMGIYKFFASSNDINHAWSAVVDYCLTDAIAWDQLTTFKNYIQDIFDSVTVHNDGTVEGEDYESIIRRYYQVL